MSIFSVVQQLLVKRFSVSSSLITYETRWCRDLDAQSLTEVEILLDIEKAFSISIPDEAWVKMRSVRDVVDYVEGLQKAE
jgi:acyl carrier protein